MLQTAIAISHDPPLHGRMNGMVSAALNASPQSSPFAQMLVAVAMLRGYQLRTSAGSAVCAIAIPAPMTVVAANSITIDGPAPRTAAAIAISHAATTRAPRAPSRAIAKEPGMAATLKSRTGTFVSAATPDSLKPS
jgi:hypothetical protein